MIRAELVITGRVQGVFYRGSAQDEAERLGLTGEIANLPDGSVDAVVEGPKAQLEAFIAWCRRGPPSARVEEVRVKWAEAKGEFRSFRVTR
jgi:acylphosphatase